MDGCPELAGSGVRVVTPVSARRLCRCQPGLALGLAMLLGPASVVVGGPPRADRPRPHADVASFELGHGALSYWLFEPRGPEPAVAPVIVFNHGWLAVNPGAYGAWIEHLVRSGNVVVFPRYQADTFTPPADFLPNALQAVTDALSVLSTGKGHVRPDRARFALIGHSAGGNLAAQMAAMAVEARLPRPRALVLMMPGEVQPSRGPDLAAIPADTLLVVAVAEQDRVVGDLRAREIFAEATAVPKSRKKYLLYRSDRHGEPRLIAHHLAPTAATGRFDSGDGLFLDFQMGQAEVNALDHAGFWRLADLTLAAAFSGQTLDEATNRGVLLRSLGTWPDGEPITSPVVGDDLSQIPRVVPTYGLRLVPWPPTRLVGRPAGPPSGTPDVGPPPRTAVGETSTRRR